VSTASDVICIGTGGDNVSNSCYIGQIFGATSSAGTAVFINSDGRLGTLTSSLRFKENVKPMDKASESLFALKPVKFRYNERIDPAHVSQFGLVAEDVEKVKPDLIVRDKEGKAYSVRYDQVNAMLLNEFLKEHKKVEALEAQLAKQQNTFESKLSVQQKQIESLAAGFQKVSAQMEISKPAPQLAARHRD
jgi:Chaperone of endosialidase